jgi:hypothetical protein
MKPLNLDNRPCSPISSNCVIWQGPDIPCIKLCTGDTVSDVIFKLGTELCAIMDQLNVTNYDLTCLGITACPPQDFQALIQLLITKICELNGIPATETKVSSGCPDCVVSVAECFVEGNQTTMQLIDYVQMIADRICSILDQINIINNQITNLDNRVTVLENTPPPTFTLPSIDTGCLATYITGNPASATIDIVLDTLLNNGTAGYCALIAATDLPANILSAVATQCITGTDNSLANPGDTFSSAYGPYTGFGTWNNTPVTAADAINNLWITVCDIYNYVSNLSNTVVDAGEGITVTSATVGSTTTYTVTNDYLESFVANLSIDNDFSPGSGVIPKVLPSSVNGVQEGQVIFRYTSVASNGQLVIAGTGAFVPNGSLPPISFGTFDNTTGLFTITDPGMYLIEAHIHLKPNSGSTQFWSGTGATVGDIGSFLIGIHPNNNTDTFVANGQALIPSVDRNVEISTSKVITATNPTTLRVKVLNTTNRDYDGTSYAGADGISLSITKLRSGLTITNL